ncbi:MAG: FtsQ-type POTRA domain-containing protein [Clostridia bacterium]|nr:FtsQ-type POTRA domain-containing protein [Clostridia bacterium]
MANRRKKKSRKLNKILFSFLFSVIVLTVLALTIPPFNISSIKVNGISKLTEDEIKALSGIQIGSNVFRTNIRRAEKNIEKDPYVVNAKIYRKFPAKILIIVEEAQPYAEAVNGEEYVEIDKSGKVLEKSKEHREGVMVIEGVSPVKCDEGEQIEYESNDYLRIQNDIFDRIEKNGLLGKIKTLNLENRSYITMETESGLEVYIGSEEELDYKLQFLATVMADEYTSGVLDLTNTEQPTYRKNK